MKKIVLLIMASAFILIMTGCSNNNQNIIVNSDEALQEMADGITERLNMPEQDTDSISDEDAKKYFSTLVNYELDKLSKYEDCTFEDEKLNDLLHSYIDACNAQLLAVEYYSNDDLYSALWNGGRTIRSGIIIELYENYNLPISKEQADSYRTEYTITTDSVLDDLITDDSNDVVLKNGDLSVVSSEGAFEEDWFNYKFVVKNNSDYELKSISVSCSICDKDDNVLETDTAYLDATISSEKQGTISGTINKDKLKNASYIIVDSFTYDGNGDNTVYELDVLTENAEKTKINVSNESDAVSSSESGEAVESIIKKYYWMDDTLDGMLQGDYSTNQALIDVGIEWDMFYKDRGTDILELQTKLETKDLNDCSDDILDIIGYIPETKEECLNILKDLKKNVFIADSWTDESGYYLDTVMNCICDSNYVITSKNDTIGSLKISQVDKYLKEKNLSVNSFAYMLGVVTMYGMEIENDSNCLLLTFKNSSRNYEFCN